MEPYNYQCSFPGAQPDDLCLTFQVFNPGKLPLKQASVKTETGFEDLEASMTELGTGILLAVHSVRCCDDELVFRPLDQRKDELEGYRKRACCFRRNGDSNSNFFTVTTTGDGTIWVRNESDRSLRFQTPDGMIYRVCTGYTEALTPSNLQAQSAPVQVLLDLGENPLDLMVSAVHVRYGEAPWQRGGIGFSLGTHIDSYFCRIFCGDDCLGVLESHSDYFLEQPRLELLDIETYGPAQWFVRNKGKKTLTLTRLNGKTVRVPADSQSYCLDIPTTNEQETAT